MRSLIASVTASAFFVVTAAPPARAHNAQVHQAMTDFAYEVLRAGALHSAGQLPDDAGRIKGVLDDLVRRQPGMAPFLRDMAKALPKLRALPSGLRDEGPKPCGASPPPPAPFPWNLPPGTALETTAMSDLPLAVNVSYDRENVMCGFDLAWAPSGLLSTTNPGQGGHRDLTGVTLGYWSSAPDYEMDDWRMRSTTLEVLQNPVVAGSAGAAVGGLAALACFLACGFFPILCAICPVLGGVAAGEVIDSIMDLDAEAMKHEDFIGLGHHVDVKPGAAAASLFDDNRGKFAFGAGPAGQPDALEYMVIALFNLMGWHVNHAASLAPTNYEIVLGAEGAIGSDGHRNTIRRSAAAWQTPILIHEQLTPVDNLAMFGWRAYSAEPATPNGTKHLGWPLHALGDATSPMHAVGATGYGHRPYEDSVAGRFPELVGSANPAASLATIRVVLERALVWRAFIAQWRQQRPAPQDVPVRDFVTAVAESSRKKAVAVPAVWNEPASLAYFVGYKDEAVAAYNSPALVALQRDTVLDGIGASLAFLVSAAEVTP